MRRRLLIEAVVVMVQTAILIGLNATIGLSGSDRETKAEAAEPLRAVQVEPTKQDPRPRKR